jgi:hypothetical protein
MVKFINKFQEIFNDILLLQTAIDHLARQNPFKETIVVYHIMKKIDPELKSLYQSIVGGIIRRRAFTTTSWIKHKTIQRL